MSSPVPTSELIVHEDVTYRRTGACDGCRRPGLVPGQCCSYIMLPLARELSDDERDWAQMHPGVMINDQNVRIEAPCGALKDDGRCGVFGTGKRPQMCADYPESPEALQGIPVPDGCLYRFERIEGGVSSLAR